MEPKKSLKSQIVLAPMAGWTDLPFRLICRKLGADIVYSEMISASGIFYNPQKSLTLAKTCLAEKPMILQLFGNNPEHFAKASEVISRLPWPSDEKIYDVYKPAGIDINFGCPAPKVFRQKSGCFLMKETLLAREILKAVKENTDLPVSIKIRAGIDQITALSFLEGLSDLDWQTLIIHGRTFKEGFFGKPDLEIIRKIKTAYPKKTIIANGGIYTPEDAKDMLEKTQADGVAIGRGAWGNPWLFSQIKEYLLTGNYKKPSLKEIQAVVLRHAEIVEATGTYNGLIELRKHLLCYFKGFAGAKEIRSELASVKDLKTIKKIVAKIVLI